VEGFRKVQHWEHNYIIYGLGKHSAVKRKDDANYWRTDAIMALPFCLFLALFSHSLMTKIHFANIDYLNDL
jgi:hypothetical protein